MLEAQFAVAAGGTGVGANVGSPGRDEGLHPKAQAAIFFVAIRSVVFVADT
jgi:hypothetical protein